MKSGSILCSKSSSPVSGQGKSLSWKVVSWEVSSAEVTSALPLTNEEKDTVKKDVLSKIGSQATVTFRVDPTILGGIVISAGGKILDGSVAGQLESMRQKLGS